MATGHISDFSGKSNNLALLKFLAALLVIYSHSYSVSGGGLDFLDCISNEEISFGGFAVGIFFFASGFYVTKSIIKRDSSKAYVVGRISRIYPAFFMTIILTAFVLGPIVSTLSLGGYFTSGETYTYLLYLLMIPHYSLPGVFKTNPKSIVNGSLWTLVLETLCYVMLYILWRAGTLKKEKLLRLMAGCIFIFSILCFGLKLSVIYSYHSYLRPLVIFFVGMLYYLFGDKIILDIRMLIAAIAGLCVCAAVGHYDLGMVLFFPYVLSCVVFAGYQVSERAARLGELSYVMYLTAFPIQQTIVAYAGNINVWLLFLWTTVVCVIISIPGYFFVEKAAGNWVSDKLGMQR